MGSSFCGRVFSVSVMLCASVRADVSSNPAVTGTGNSSPANGGSGLELSDDQQEFSFKSRRFSLSIPGGPTFVLPPGVVLPPDMMLKLQSVGTTSAPAAPSAAVDNGLQNGPLLATSIPQPSPVIGGAMPGNNNVAEFPPGTKSLAPANKQGQQMPPKNGTPKQPTGQNQLSPGQRATYKEAGLSGYQGYGRLVVGPARKSDFRVLNDWEK